MKTFNLPDLGEGLSEVEIVNWHVSEGDNVVADTSAVDVFGLPLVALDEQLRRAA